MKDKIGIAVIAGDYNDFLRFVNYMEKELHITDKLYVYCNSQNRDKIKANEFKDVLMIGTWYTPKDSFEFLEFCRSRVR